MGYPFMPYYSFSRTLIFFIQVGHQSTVQYSGLKLILKGYSYFLTPAFSRDIDFLAMISVKIKEIYRENSSA